MKLTRWPALLLAVVAGHVGGAEPHGLDLAALPERISRQIISTTKTEKSVHQVVHYLSDGRVLMSGDVWLSADQKTTLRRAFTIYDMTLPVNKPGEPCRPATPLLVIYQFYHPFPAFTTATHHLPEGCILQAADADEASPRTWRVSKNAAVLLSLIQAENGEITPQTRAEFQRALEARIAQLSAKK